jgi:hypothetical protein
MCRSEKFSIDPTDNVSMHVTVDDLLSRTCISLRWKILQNKNPPVY